MALGAQEDSGDCLTGAACAAGPDPGRLPIFVKTAAGGGKGMRARPRTTIAIRSNGASSAWRPPLRRLGRRKGRRGAGRRILAQVWTLPSVVGRSLAAAPLTAGLGVTDKASRVLAGIGYRARSYRAIAMMRGVRCEPHASHMETGPSFLGCALCEVPVLRSCPPRGGATVAVDRLPPASWRVPR